MSHKPMMQDSFPSWLAMTLGAIIPAAGGALAWVRFRSERNDRSGDRDAEQRERVRISMDAQSQAMWLRLETENKRLTVRLAAVERDRDRGWDLARWWNAEAHRVRHTLLNPLHAANLALEMSGLGTINVPDTALPNIEDVILPERDGREMR